MARTLVLGCSLAIICLLAFLTLSVALRDGVDILVVVSGIVLLLMGVGVLGALSTPPPAPVGSLNAGRSWSRNHRPSTSTAGNVTTVKKMMMMISVTTRARGYKRA